MASDFSKDLDGYKLFTGREGHSGEYPYGIKIFVKINREFTEADQDLQWRVSDMIHDELLEESIRLNPGSRERAHKERVEILSIFADPIFVEEIQNGYCSRYCCKHLPWFVVTTKRGRIKIGWRKSVICIEWTDSAINRMASDIFPKEEAWPGYETTQFDKIIHAHGIEAAGRYVQRLMDA